MSKSKKPIIMDDDDAYFAMIAELNALSKSKKKKHDAAYQKGYDDAVADMEKKCEQNPYIA